MMSDPQNAVAQEIFDKRYLNTVVAIKRSVNILIEDLQELLAKMDKDVCADLHAYVSLTAHPILIQATNISLDLIRYEEMRWLNEVLEKPTPTQVLDEPEEIEIPF